MMENIISKLREMKERKIAELNLPQGETTDMQLKSLRRQRQHQMEEQEKIKLKKQIAFYQKEERAKHLFGVVRKIKVRKMSRRRNKNILHDDNPLLRNF